MPHPRLKLYPLIRHWDSLDKQQQTRLIRSLNKIDRGTWREQIRVLTADSFLEPVEPLPSEWITKIVLF